MTLYENDYRYAYKISRRDMAASSYPSEYMKFVRQELIYKVANDIFSQMLDSGNFHVLKFDLLRDDNDFDCITFYLRISHTIAKQKHVHIPVWDELGAIPKTAVSCCQWCGNVLSFDSRGGCSSCGGNPSIVRDKEMIFNSVEI